MWQSCGMPCSVHSSNMAVIQEKQRETPSKKPVSQEDRKGLSTRDNQDNQKESRAGRQGGEYCGFDTVYIFYCAYRKAGIQGGG